MLIDSFEAEKIVDGSKKGKEFIDIYLDLGLVKQSVFLKKDDVIIDNQSYKISVFFNMIKTNAIYELGENVEKLAFFAGKYYKLSPIPLTAPTIEINGIRMHRTKNLTPLEDARSKIALLNIKPKEEILDLCTGLGYTAIEAYKRKAKITTVEIDKNVLTFAKKNPYSRGLFEGIEKQEIKLILDNAFFAVKKFKKETFDAIINDPPRFSMSGELYSKVFYLELFRILKKKGRLFHYVGSPGSKYQKKDIISGVKIRLREVGFKINKIKDVESVLAYKL